MLPPGASKEIILMYWTVSCNRTWISKLPLELNGLFALFDAAETYFSPGTKVSFENQDAEVPTANKPDF
jgi:hypothetical protein